MRLFDDVAMTCVPEEIPSEELVHVISPFSKGSNSVSPNGQRTPNSVSTMNNYT
ncbi:hypothetical protein DPMN_074233 [Dreissena polymorpha]|uniref:Uncharacterized protein n=1 Tax=Dreissena polymorpha TaxID=45954 RepID=A0A9D3YEL0_DREPO|nr:hypothetical protein DPMN_074233 [Dreissena polymorpha]